MASAASKRGIGEGRFGIGCGEALDQRRVWAKFFGSAVQLALVTEYDSGSIGKRMYSAANLDLLTAQRLQIANIFAVLPQADDREATGSVAGFRTAKIEKAGAVVELNHVVDLGADTHVLVEVLADFEIVVARS